MKNLRTFEMIEFVREKKFCSLADLMEKFQISIATVHRDIAGLVASGKLRKVRGGVAAIERPESLVLTSLADHYQERLEANLGVKIEIADRAIREIRDGDIIFLDSSTTVYYLSKALQNAAFSHLTIITNSVLIIQEFPLFPPSYFLIGLGGNYDLQLNAFLGQATLRELENLNLDKAFISALGITSAGITSRHENHAFFLRRVLELSRRKYLLVGSDKFDKPGIFKIAPLSAVDEIISESPAPGYFYGKN